MSAGWRAASSSGVRADARLAPALAPGYFRPQERSLADHLALVATIAGKVRFAGPPGSDGGTWAKLFEHEPAAIMAEILAFPVDARRVTFAEQLEVDLAAAAAAIRGLARQVETWLGRLAAAGDRRLHAAVEAERGVSATVLRALARAEPTPAGVLAMLATTGGEDALGWAKAGLQALRAAHEALLGTISGFRAIAEPALVARLGSGEIDPALGLLVAELRLLAEAEAQVNTVTDRHTRYYYRSVLGQAPRPAQPESVFLRFEPGASSVALPEGARLAARTPGRPEVQTYRLADGITVTPVHVAKALTLRYDRDPLISPQSEMRFVTGVRAAQLELRGRDGGQRLFTPAPEGAVSLGFAVASPMLLLAEGRRRIEVRLALTRRDEGALAGGGGTEAVLAADPALLEAFGPDAPQEAADRLAEQAAALPHVAGLDARARTYWACVLEATTAEQVRCVFGRIVAASLVEGAPWPEADYRSALLERAQALLGEDAAAVVERLLGRPRLEAFQAVLQDAFTFTLSTEQGPMPVGAVEAAPAAEGAGITFAFSLDMTAPAIVPSTGEAAPVLTIRTAREARFCAVSLLEPFAIEAIGIAVAAEGLTRLTSFSDDGPVDVSQPFLPFGARPRDGAVFLVGTREMAAKPVTHVGATLTWTDLPRSAGGWAEHYHAYETFVPPRPELRLDYLSGEGWKALAEAPVPMVVASGPDTPLHARRRIESRVPGRPEAARVPPAEAEFRQRQSIRSGLLSLTLVCPGEGFGQSAYPQALARAMRPRLVPQLERPIPPPPYIPQIGAITLDYRAEAVMALNAPAAARPGERVVQIGAFGEREIFPAHARLRAGLFPHRLADGTLFVQLAGRGARDLVSLVFEMAQGSHQRLPFAPRPVEWHYLTANGWHPLPSWSLEADSTDGLMRSGLVSLRLPDDAVLESTEMPGQGVWIAIGVHAHLDAYPRLTGIAANGARAERVDALGEAGAEAARTWTLDPAVPGLGPITQVGPTFGGAAAETEAGFRTRLAERLRHRGRAVTAWDVERLVLAAFPEVWQVKCFPTVDRAGHSAPGSLTVVAVPWPPADAAEQPAQARTFDVLLLRRIEAHVAARTSTFATVTVRNPSFDRLQVRAMVGFGQGGDDGTLARRLKLDVSRFLAVWTAEGPLARFGWSVNLNDIGAYIAELPYVEFLTEFSILHLVADDLGRYRLHDTARSSGNGDAGARMLASAEPWSLALPMRDHMIASARERRIRAAHPAGIGGLGIGETLIVDSGADA